MEKQVREFLVQPIQFGTDGWRGVIGQIFTSDRLTLVAPIAAQILAQFYGAQTQSNTVVVGYDRRFMSEDFAQITAEAVQKAGFDVLLANTYAPTPALSWAAKHLGALGALVITASHNPGKYSGLKVKGAFGGSVPLDVTHAIEQRLRSSDSDSAPVTPGTLRMFDPWVDCQYCEALQAKVDLAAIQAAIAQGRLTVFVDPMHGATAGGIEKLLGATVHELNTNRDPLFDGGAPEPLPNYIQGLIQSIQSYSRAPDQKVVGLVFDGDGDRIAAVDGNGEFMSSQILIPILIEHLVARRGMQGELVKTVSGSDLMPLVAKSYNLPVFETAVGYKYIADRMLETQVLLGGEESGGIGYGHHIPERDAFLSALYVLEAIAQSGQDLGSLYANLQQRSGFQSAYDRIDLPLASMAVRAKLLDFLKNQPLPEIAGQAVIDCNAVDGYKFRLADQRWLMIRFSGTEPVLRLYCEAATLENVHETLDWAKNWAMEVADN
jgi:phosphomannomutase